MKRVDADGDGQVSFDEFVEGMVKQQEIQHSPKDIVLDPTRA